MNEKQSLLELIHLTKKFPGVIAVNDFSLNLSTGKVHGLIGENGSGKSTLIKMISGAYRPDEGKIIVDGEEHLYMTPKISRQHGIEVIYQEFNLIEGLSVAENVCFGEETGKLVKFSELRNKTKNIFEFMNVNVNPDALVQDLPVAQKQLVEIAKAISKQARLIIMDEPTAPLTVTEVDSLFSIIRRLKDQGVTIIFVSHRIEELFEITDEITIMRDGLFVDTLNSKECDRHTSINLMVGRELSEDYPRRSNIKEKKLLELKNVTGNGINNVSLCVHEGEVVGLAGLVGAGRTELASVIIGAAKLESGEIILDGESIHCKSPQKAIAQGIGMIPEDRKKQGCFLHSGVDWNISISTLKKLSHPVMNLSGGNQQKVVIAKVLAADSRVIIFDEPTRGIDVGAKHEIYTLMKKLADEGKAILMISSDMEELLGMSDRIYVLSGGNITGELGRDEYSQSHILELASVN